MRMSAMFMTLLMATSGCVMTNGAGSLGSAADNLDSRAQHFYDEVRHDADYSYRDDRDARDHDYRSDDHTVRDAEALANAADDFHRAVERGESREELNGEFDRVAEHYHHLREYYDDRGRSREERDRFQAVTDAYVEAEGALKYRDTRHG
ncbi:MAG TPA: hypothetical protein VKB41_01660 [Steroidobacteraceae bacterium]|nr:hypothetical protein [Steroidobacteraceae bacterium]